MVPKGWIAKELDEICEKVAVGLAISVTPFMRKSGVKLIRNQNIKRNYFDSSSVVFIDEDFAKSNKSKMVQRGDVVAVRTGSNIGEACVVPQEFEGALTFTTLIARPKKDVLDSFYLATHINSEIGINEVNRLCAGGGKPNLNSGELKHYRISTPPLAEQKKIAQILTTWDQAIATTERLLDLARQQKKALMQQLLTGKKRFPGFEGKWKLTCIAQMGKVVSGGTPDTENEDYWNGDINWLTPTDVTALKGKYVKDTSRRITTDGVKDSAAKLLPPGTLLICTRATIGAMAISTTDITTNQGFKNLTPNGKHCVEFLYFTFDFFVHQFIRKASGSTFLELSKYDFERIEFLIPSLEEQRKIASVLMDADQEIETLQSQLDGLKQEKKALMQALLTGKRRVQIAEAEVV